MHPARFGEKFRSWELDAIRQLVQKVQAWHFGCRVASMWLRLLPMPLKMNKKQRSSGGGIDCLEWKPHPQFHQDECWRRESSERDARTAAASKVEVLRQTSQVFRDFLLGAYKKQSSRSQTSDSVNFFSLLSTCGPLPSTPWM